MEFDYNNPQSIFFLTHEQVTRKFLLTTFAIMGKQTSPILDASTKIKITKDIVNSSDTLFSKCPNIKELEGTETTVGRVLVYLFLFNIPFNFFPKSQLLSKNENAVEVHGNLLHYVDFINKPLTKRNLGSYDDRVAALLIDGKIDVLTVRKYTDYLQWLGYTTASFNLPSLDMSTVNPSKKIKAFRDKKLKEHKEAFANKDLAVIAAVETEILDFASKELTDNKVTGKLIYDSGFNGSFSNNYKVTAIFRGIAPKSDNINEFEILTSSLSDGVAKGDIAAHADLGVLAAAGRAKDTQLAGYKTKIFNAAFGSMVAGKYLSDCKTKKTLQVELTEKNYNNYLYRNILDKDNKLINLNHENRKFYINKKVNLRSPLFCNDYEICNKCFGDMIYKLEMRNVGLHISRITTKLMNLSMKAFHNMSVEPRTYNLLDYIDKSKK